MQSRASGVDVARAADVAYAALREMILTGGAAAGSRLGEAELAGTLGLSRTPVREALARLGADGLVEVLPHKGARVVRWSAADLEEIFELRGVLEPYAAGRAARRGLPDGALAELEAFCDGMEEAAAAGGFQRVAELNDRFHAAVIAASGNRRLPPLLTSVVHAPLVLGTFHRYDAASLARSMAHHREITAALRARDPAWAGAVMRSHIRAAAGHLIDHVRTSEDSA
ncbi:GntR family transcriptional regulator [Actinomadura parmotrematis]|uniref:GntR family transcriptional regulator n=1 Tax=Actinomadura parmotrematis TaxID=2864039 RepID=A0ABS7FR20_9ACTN|nr:GntR family transcriptional regulator [Actinomadura parmotrematis]MBW8482827.1 GntR family transcriptional regulator [Actinomadura parmotrematis]